MITLTRAEAAATRKRNQRKHTPPPKLVQGFAWQLGGPWQLGLTVPEQGRALIELPLRTSGQGNNRVHWRVEQKKTDHQRMVTEAWLRQLGAANWRTSVKRVRFVRLAPRALDCDNNVSSNKHIRDQVAAWLAGHIGIKARGDDGPKCGISWEYAQQKHTHWGVRIELIT